MDMAAKARMEGPACGRCTLPTITIPAVQQGVPPVESNLEYVPYEKTVVEMEPYERKEVVSKEVWVTEYETVKRKGVRKVEKTVTDYITVEYITEYVEEPETITRTEMVEQEIIENVVKLVPIERSVVHYPSDLATRSEVKSYLPPATTVTDSVYQTIDPSSDLKQSIFYNPTLRKSVPTLYGLVNLATAVNFDNENKDSVVFESLADGYALETPDYREQVPEPLVKPMNATQPQRFKLVNRGNSYSIYNPATRQFLDLASPSAAPGSRVKFSQGGSSPTQNWYLDMVQGTVAKVRNVVDPEPVLGRDKFGRVELQEDVDSRSQLWNVIGLQLLGQY